MNIFCGTPTSILLKGQNGLLWIEFSNISDRNRKSRAFLSRNGIIGVYETVLVSYGHSICKIRRDKLPGSPFI